MISTEQQARVALVATLAARVQQQGEPMKADILGAIRALGQWWEESFKPAMREVGRVFVRIGQMIVFAFNYHAFMRKFAPGHMRRAMQLRQLALPAPIAPLLLSERMNNDQ